MAAMGNGAGFQLRRIMGAIPHYLCVCGHRPLLMLIIIDFFLTSEINICYLSMEYKIITHT